MSKEIKSKQVTASMINDIKRVLKDKYFNVWMSKFDISGIDDYYTEQFLLKNLFNKGNICVFNLKGYGPVATSYAVQSWGLNHRPITIEPISEEVQHLLPKKLTNEKDVVLGYINSSRSSVVSNVNMRINRIADLYAAMFVNLQINKLPFLINSENVDYLNLILDRIYSNELAVFCPKDVSDAISVFNTGAEYLLDKYWAQILNEESQLLSELGIDCNTLNMAAITVDQSNANNMIITTINDGYDYHLKHLTDKVNELFGVNWSIKVKQVEVTSFHEDEAKEEVTDDETI